MQALQDAVLMMCSCAPDYLPELFTERYAHQACGRHAVSPTCAYLLSHVDGVVAMALLGHLMMMMMMMMMMMRTTTMTMTMTMMMTMTMTMTMMMMMMMMMSHVCIVVLLMPAAAVFMLWLRVATIVHGTLAPVGAACCHTLMRCDALGHCMWCGPCEHTT
jgi:hypothetical protein